MKQAARELAAMGPEWVLVKGQAVVIIVSVLNVVASEACWWSEITGPTGCPCISSNRVESLSRPTWDPARRGVGDRASFKLGKQFGGSGQMHGNPRRGNCPIGPTKSGPNDCSLHSSTFYLVVL